VRKAVNQAENIQGYVEGVSGPEEVLSDQGMGQK